MVGKWSIVVFEKGTAAFAFLKCGHLYGAQHWTAAFLPHMSTNVIKGKHAICAVMFVFALMSWSASVFVFQ